MSSLSLDSLHAEEQEKIQLLASVRGESIQETLNKFDNKKKIRQIPGTFSKFNTNPIGVEFKEAGIEKGIPYVKLPNDRIFYGHFPNKRHSRIYEYLQDLFSPVLSVETSLLAMDVSSRYVKNWSRYPNELLPKQGGVIVEVGAYLGHKTVRFCDYVVGTEGKILAIEVLPENFKILCSNVEKNNLQNCINVIECGVWKSQGEMVLKGKGLARNSLINIDQVALDEQMIVKTDTLDNILASWNDEIIDFIDIRVNGAEIEVLQGLQQGLDRIKVIFVATPYSRDGKSTYSICLELLRERGCRILPQTTQTAIYAVPEKFANNYIY